MKIKSKFSVFERTLSWLLSVVMLFGVFSVIENSLINVQAANRSTSKNGIELIKSFEGCRLTAYKAVSTEQYYTIGYGHYGSDVYAGMTITQSQAEDMLSNDLKKYEGYVNTFLNNNGIDVNQNQFDALVSFTYNLGNVWVSTPQFQLKTILCNGVSNYSNDEIITAFTNWNKSGGKVLDGLTKRRKKEAEYFLSGQNFFPGTEDTSYAVPVSLKAKQHGNTYDSSGNVESNRWIDEGDDCYIEKVYTNGFCHVEYPAGNERRWAYAKVSVFDIPKKNSNFPGAEDTSYAVPVRLNANRKDNTYDNYGNVESGRWIDAGDSCYIEKVYTNGFCRVQYPAGSEQRWAYAKADVFSIPKKNSGFPGAEDTSYAVPVRLNANQTDNTYDDYGNMESNHWIDAGDNCYIEKVYTNGFCRVQYPAGSEQRWAYVKASIFNIPKKNSGFPGAEDTSYAVPVWLNAKAHDNTYDSNGNMESNRWIDAGDNCYIDKVYQNGFCHVEYPAGSTRRWAYAKASLFDLSKTHNYTVTVISPTCTEQGYTLHKCSHCSDSYKDNYKNALGHDYQLVSQKAATCTANGEKVYRCSRCGLSKTETINATGHSYSTSVVAPTCTVQGYTLHKCNVCGSNYKDSYTDAKGHTMSSWTTTKAAACTENGSQTRKCQTCGYTETSDIVATGHNYTAQVIAPTCNNQGYTLHTCSKCGNNYKDNYTNAGSHNFGAWTGTKSATCTEKGSQTRKCQTCGYTETAEIAAKGHEYTEKVISPTQTEQGYTLHTCSVCGSSYKDNYKDKLPIIIDENTPQIIVENKTAPAGSEVKVNVSLKNNPGISSMGLTLKYEKTKLTLKAVNYNSAMGGQSMQPQTMDSPVILNWISPIANYNGDGTYAELVFKVSDKAESGAVPIEITYDSNNVYNLNDENVAFAVKNGTVTVKDYIPGDINNDGVVNNKDFSRLFQYLSGWNVAVNEAALDVNGDGSVNNKDATRLFQYVSGWNVNIY